MNFIVVSNLNHQLFLINHYILFLLLAFASLKQWKEVDEVWNKMRKEGKVKEDVFIWSTLLNAAAKRGEEEELESKQNEEAEVAKENVTNENNWKG